MRGGPIDSIGGKYSRTITGYMYECLPARHRLRLQARRAGGSAANWEFLCGRHFQLIQEFMEGSGGEVDHRGFGPKGYLVSIFQLIGLV